MLSPPQSASNKKSPLPSPSLAGGMKHVDSFTSISNLDLDYCSPPFSGSSATSSIGSSSRSTSMRDREFSISKRKLSSTSLINLLAEEDEVDKYLAVSKEVDLIEEVGQGTSAVVYKGLYKNRIVAVKELKLRFDKELKSYQEEEFLNEVKQTKLEHPFITGLIAVVAQPSANENDPGYYYIISRYAEGGSLAEFLLKNVDPNYPAWEWHLAIANDTAQGLYFLHTKNIIHRDLKSENVLLHNKQSRAMICDFGLSIDQETNTNSVRNEPCGTYKYWSPELLQVLVDELVVEYEKQKKRIDVSDDIEPDTPKRYFPYSFESDVYAFGILLWELKHHKKPFHGRGASIQLYKDIISKRDRPAIKQNTLTIAFDNLINACWEQDPKKRPRMQTVSEQLSSLKPF